MTARGAIACSPQAAGRTVTQPLGRVPHSRPPRIRPSVPSAGWVWRRQARQRARTAPVAADDLVVLSSGRNVKSGAVLHGGCQHVDPHSLHTESRPPTVAVLVLSAAAAEAGVVPPGTGLPGASPAWGGADQADGGRWSRGPAQARQALEDV